jgi:large conductance mechanosensitive channel
MLREFRAFVLRGNMVDLAVAVVIGTAFTEVVNALVEDLITPLIAAVGGEPNFGSLAFTINDSRFAYGTSSMPWSRSCSSRPSSSSSWSSRSTR